MKSPQYLDQAFEKVCQEALATFIKKHKDYGKGNILDMGELGIAFRISEKFNRIKHLLMNGKKPENESLDDSWIDIAVYAIIAILLRRGWFEKLNLKENLKKQK
ncbi:MAG: nucleotide modification associated domain-containing protein [Microgenomates group bacterium]|nr:nucleotide modification associated domain-containing protein [Microgenomates group bacterium]